MTKNHTQLTFHWDRWHCLKQRLVTCAQKKKCTKHTACAHMYTWTPVSAKASLPISLSLLFPFPLPSTFCLRLKCTLRSYLIYLAQCLHCLTWCLPLAKAASSSVVLRKRPTRRISVDSAAPILRQTVSSDCLPVWEKTKTGILLVLTLHTGSMNMNLKWARIYCENQRKMEGESKGEERERVRKAD